MLNLSNEQLTRLALHMTGINNILIDALLNPPGEAFGTGNDVEIEMFVVGTDKGKKEPTDK
jgi:hypothetical protein